MLLCSTLLLAVGFGALSGVLGGVITDPTLVSNHTYDYIIVGGGLTGLTVAGRLTENPNIQVLVIEAGNDDRTNPVVYDIYRYGDAFGTKLDWSYPADQGRSILAGKTLGGSSSINGAAWTRGLKQQYDSWLQLLDPADANSGWDWNGMFSYMKKAESFTPPNSGQLAKGANSISSYHGFTGPVHAAFPLYGLSSKLMYGGPQEPAFASVMVKFGLVKYKDLNGGTPNCVSFTPDSNGRAFVVNQPRGLGSPVILRVAYLSPVESQRKGWTTLVGQQVTKILFNPSTALPRVATGVQFGTSSGKRFTALARKEVILAAGAIGSPKVLQLSGIGDAAALSSLGIQSVVNLPTVGKNLQEQTLSALGAGGTNFNVGGSGPSDVIAYPNLYQLFGSQASAMVNHITQSISAWASSQAKSALSASALQTIFGIQANLIIQDNAPVAELFQVTNYPDKLGTIIWPLLPFSRGTVQITSSNPFVPPKTTVNYFSVDFDLSTQIAAARMVRRSFQTSPLSGLSTGETVPGFSTVPDDANHGSDANWTKWIKSQFSSVAHPIATCAMMSRSLGGVVDARLRVYDTQNVRVVDASIMPLQISAHLSSTLYGIAEKAADIIKSGL
ncbi:GMC oxidoreductase [Hydnum rufescens UP504]|uniref:GMC oxidoreductase n=1 Tax=Hydnum rufescens UP504 TaxID=1448309 RepID=A0A9P6B4L7_9AGAM|nr:GMC oxidoreductase [Hydnum rufescens UP504]